MLSIRTRTSRLMQDLDTIIRDTMRIMLMGKLGIMSNKSLKRLEYFILYSPGKISKKKIIAAIFIKKRGQKRYEKITAEEIEKTGASLYEFISYLKTLRSKKIKPDIDILENL